MPFKPKKKWVLNENGNYCLYGDGYFVSYNPSVHFSLRQRSRQAFARYKEAEDPEETALSISRPDEWLILNGDFRKEYEACNTAEECRAVFQMYAPYHKSKWSSF